jgi:Ser/Thr protein kinase RdoA (MazF antagonist)
VTDINDSPAAASDAGTALLRRSERRDGGRPPSAEFDEAALVQELERLYDLGRWRSWRKTESGKSNASYFVATDGGQVVLRRSSPVKTLPAARFEAALIRHLADAGYPAPPVVPTRDGEVVVEVDGHIHMVTRLLPGAPYDKAGSTQLAAAARGLGRYHALVCDLPTDPTAHESSSLSGLSRRCGLRLAQVWQLVEPLLDASRAASLRSDLDYLVHEIGSLDVTFEPIQSGLTHLIVHGSYGRTALLFTGQDLTGVVDYDRAVHDFLVLDLAYALKSFARPRSIASDGGWIDVDRAGSFLDSYRIEFPLSDADVTALTLALRTHRLATVDKKCGNVLTKHALVARRPYDAAGFAGLIAREVRRLRWIASHEPELGRAFDL